MRAFYIGRFQPYHLGHQQVLEQISQEADEIVIGIGSAQLSHTASDPFTSGERVMMITRSLKHLGKVLYAIPIEDIRRNAVWVSHVRSMTPHFDVAYTNNPYVIRLFEESGVKVKKSPLYQREKFSGTEIRRRMLSNEPWEHLVPIAVVNVIKEINGVQRLKDVFKNDEFFD